MEFRLLKKMFEKTTVFDKVCLQTLASSIDKIIKSDLIYLKKGQNLLKMV